MFPPRPARSRRRLAVLSVAILVALWPAGPAGAQSTTETYRDSFDSVAFNGDNGTIAWAGPWIETGESDGPTGGRVRVVIQSQCVAGGCGRLSANGNTTAGLQREVDVNGASGVSLTFDYRRSKGGGNAGVVQVSVSPNGGASWSTLETFVLDTDDGAALPRSYAISSFASAATRVRFMVVSNPGETGTFYFDNVQIVATFPPPPTTTTTTTSTSTTSVPPTSTTGPPTSTTAPPTSTTAPPSSTSLPASSTSGPPSPTTTTLPPIPATTSPGATAPPEAATATSTAPAATTSVVTAPSSEEQVRPLFPVVLPADPLRLTSETPIEPRRLVALDRDLSNLVLHPMAGFVTSRSLPRKAVEPPVGDAIDGATAGARSAVLTAWPLGVATLGFFLTRLTAPRRREKPSSATISEAHSVR